MTSTNFKQYETDKFCSNHNHRIYDNKKTLSSHAWYLIPLTLMCPCSLCMKHCILCHHCKVIQIYSHNVNSLWTYITNKYKLYKQERKSSCALICFFNHHWIYTVHEINRGRQLIQFVDSKRDPWAFASRLVTRRYSTVIYLHSAALYVCIETYRRCLVCFSITLTSSRCYRVFYIQNLFFVANVRLLPIKHFYVISFILEHP